MTSVPDALSTPQIKETAKTARAGMVDLREIMVSYPSHTNPTD
jgi:hypothetical protein